MSEFCVLVMKQVWRKPSAVSKRVSWAPGWGRSRRMIPGGKRDEVGQFGDPGTVPDGAVGLFGREPVLFLDQDQGVTNSLVDGESYGEVAVGRNDAVHEPVGGTGRVGPHQDRVGDEGRLVVTEVAGLVLLGQPRQRMVEQTDVVAGVVGPGSPRAQHGGQRFIRRVTPHAEREEPEALLVGGSGVLLLL